MTICWTKQFVKIGLFHRHPNNKMQKIHTISTPPVMNTSNTSTTSDLIASVVAGHKINNKPNNSNRKISSSVVVSNHNNNNHNNHNNNDRSSNIIENGSALKIANPTPAKANGKNGNFAKNYDAKWWRSISTKRTLKVGPLICRCERYNVHKSTRSENGDWVANGWNLLGSKDDRFRFIR